jgi:hypothetical protein
MKHPGRGRVWPDRGKVGSTNCCPGGSWAGRGRAMGRIRPEWCLVVGKSAPAASPSPRGPGGGGVMIEGPCGYQGKRSLGNASVLAHIGR